MAAGRQTPADATLAPESGSADSWMSRSLRLLLGAAAILLVLAFPLTALAQGETVGGTLVYRADGERTPIEGATISVSQDGTQIGTAVSDDEGRWELPLPGPGTYQVSLDVATLPQGVTPTDPSRVDLANVEVLGGQRKAVIFPLGEGSATEVSMYARLGALFVAGLKLGATIALAAVGLSLV